MKRTKTFIFALIATGMMFASNASANVVVTEQMTDAHIKCGSTAVAYEADETFDYLHAGCSDEELNLALEYMHTIEEN